MIHFLLHVLGLDNASGPAYLTWSGVLGDASILGGFFLWLRKSGKQHAQRMAQEARHHLALMNQDAEHHKAHMELLRRHHSQVLDATAGSADVTVTASLPPMTAEQQAQLRKEIRRRGTAGPAPGGERM